LNRTGTLLFAIILLAVFAGILFCSFSLIMPLHSWTEWRVPILIAAGGAVALLVAWASFSPMRQWVMDGLATVLSLTSAIPAIGITLLITYGLGLQLAEHRGRWDGLLYQMTNPLLLWQLAYFAVIPVVPGAIGLGIGRKRAQKLGRVSLAGMAARFSTLGLGLSGMVGTLAIVGALCRRVMWP
jgi:hypothetical protein